MRAQIRWTVDLLTRWALTIERTDQCVAAGGVDMPDDRSNLASSPTEGGIDADAPDSNPPLFVG